MKELNVIKDASGAVMGVLRDGDAKFRHVVRFHPQRGLQAAAGIGNALSAVAMQAQLAAIERAIAEVSDQVRSIAGKLDDRFQSELAAAESLLLETYRAARYSGFLTKIMWSQIAGLALLVRQHQEYADRQLRRLTEELAAKRSVKDRRSWLKSKRTEIREALHSVERASRMSVQFGSLRLWHLAVADDPALAFYKEELAESIPSRELAVRELHAELLKTLEHRKPGRWTSFHSPLDSRRVRGMLDEVAALLEEAAPGSPTRDRNNDAIEQTPGEIAQLELAAEG